MINEVNFIRTNKFILFAHHICLCSFNVFTRQHACPYSTSCLPIVFIHSVYSSSMSILFTDHVYSSCLLIMFTHRAHSSYMLIVSTHHVCSECLLIVCLTLSSITLRVIISSVYLILNTDNPQFHCNSSRYFYSLCCDGFLAYRLQKE